MDSTPTPTSPTVNKLPIKRKHTQPPLYDVVSPPPFKFHRIWTEPDEIRFLECLLDCSGLSFPRDLPIFYSRFSNTMSQPYTKSQLSEKLRRLRKKFRVISSRLAKGFHFSMLSPHDQALYGLSKQLWHPDYAATSPFSSNGSGNVNVNVSGSVKSNLVGVKVRFSPTLSSSSPSLNAIIALPSAVADKQVVREREGENVPSTTEFFPLPFVSEKQLIDESNEDNVEEEEIGFDAGLDFDDGYQTDMKLSEVNVAMEDDGLGEKGDFGVGADKVGVLNVAMRSIVDVFDQSLKEAKLALDRREKDGKDFENRWKEQRVAEFEVLAKRLRLVVDDYLQRPRQ